VNCQNIMGALDDSVSHGGAAHGFPLFKIAPVAQVGIPEFGFVVAMGVFFVQVMTVGANVVNHTNRQRIFIYLDAARNAAGIANGFVHHHCL